MLNFPADFKDVRHKAEKEYGVAMKAKERVGESLYIVSLQPNNLYYLPASKSESISE